MEKVPAGDKEISQARKFGIRKKTCARKSIPKKPPLR